MSYEQKLKSLGIELPEVAKPLAAYVPAVMENGYIYTSGQLPTTDGKLQYVGKLGGEVDVQMGYAAAKLCAINCLATIRALAGSLDNVEKIVKVVGFVNSMSDFTEQPKVINGASEFLVEVFGEAGKHARSAVGVNVLPLNSPVEVEMIVKLKA